MKKLLFAFAVTALLLPFAPQAKSQDVSIDFFYNNLNGGSWIEVGNYGYCWQLDVEFDIGPGYYNFVDVRYIGEPVLRSRIVDVSQNVTYINQTVNVTNITYKNKTVYNYGPDLNVVNQYSSRPIQKLKIERQANVDVAAAAKSGGLMKVQGNALMVSAPTTIKKSATQIAPPSVKTKVADAKVEKGWSVAGDANAQTQLKEKIKTQDLKKVPPPTAGGNAAATAGASASVSPAASLAPVEKGKGKQKGKAAEQFQAGATASPAGALTSPTTSPAFPEKGKHKGKTGEPMQSGAATSPITSPSTAMSPSIAPQYGKPGKGRRAEQFGGPSPTTAPSAGAEEITKPEGKHKGFERQNLGPTPAGAGSPGQNLSEPRGKKKQFEQQQPGMSPAGTTSPGESFNQPGGKHNKRIEQPGMSPSGQEGAPGAPGGPYGEGRDKHKAEGVNQPPAGAANQPVQGGEGKGKKKGAAESPAPTP